MSASKRVKELADELEELEAQQEQQVSDQDNCVFSMDSLAASLMLLFLTLLMCLFSSLLKVYGFILLSVCVLYLGAHLAFGVKQNLLATKQQSVFRKRMPCDSMHLFSSWIAWQLLSILMVDVHEQFSNSILMLAKSIIVIIAIVLVFKLDLLTGQKQDLLFALSFVFLFVLAVPFHDGCFITSSLLTNFIRVGAHIILYFAVRHFGKDHYRKIIYLEVNRNYICLFFISWVYFVHLTALAFVIVELALLYQFSSTKRASVVIGMPLDEDEPSSNLEFGTCFKCMEEKKSSREDSELGSVYTNPSNDREFSDERKYSDYDHDYIDYSEDNYSSRISNNVGNHNLLSRLKKKNKKKKKKKGSRIFQTKSSYKAPNEVVYSEEEDSFEEFNEEKVKKEELNTSTRLKDNQTDKGTEKKKRRKRRM